MAAALLVVAVLVGGVALLRADEGSSRPAAAIGSQDSAPSAPPTIAPTGLSKARAFFGRDDPLTVESVVVQPPNQATPDDPVLGALVVSIGVRGDAPVTFDNHFGQQVGDTILAGPNCGYGQIPGATERESTCTRSLMTHTIDPGETFQLTLGVLCADVAGCEPGRRQVQLPFRSDVAESPSPST